jgi:hypothetical protein
LKNQPALRRKVCRGSGWMTGVGVPVAELFFTSCLPNGHVYISFSIFKCSGF